MKLGRRILAIMMTVLMLVSMMPTAMAEIVSPVAPVNCDHSFAERFPNGEPQDCQDWKKVEAYCTKCGYVRWTGEYCGDCQLGNWEQDPNCDPPTCTEGSIEIRSCIFCGECMDEREVGPLGHDWKTSTSGGDCKTLVTVISTCSRCSATKNEAGGYGDHKWGEWVVVSQGNCKTSGAEERSCSICGKEEYRAGAYGDHKWGDWTTKREATCTKDGIRKHECSVCGFEESEYIDKLSHKWGEWVVIQEPEQSLGQPGIKERKCSRCGLTEQMKFYPEGANIRGDSGSDIKEIQEELNDKGYDCGTPDGKFGPNTEEAWKNWQEDNGYPVDGIMWPEQVDELLGGDSGADFQHITVEKSITSTPANGEYYQLGEKISFLIKVVIPEGKTITDLEVTDPLKGGNEDATLDILPVATSADNTEYVFNYVVTAEDVERGYVENSACAYFFDPEGDAWVEEWSETVGAPTGLSGSERGTLTKKVINTPANGEYFTVGESIMYEIHFTNHCDYFVSDIAIKDPLLSGGKDEALDVIGVLWGGGIHRQYVVTEEDAAAGVVTNTATAEWTDPETGEAQFITSNTVVTPVGFGENGDGIVLTKSVVNMPENGIFHNGNTIQYEIQIANVSNETYNDVIVYDQILEFAELKTYDVMEPGFTDTIGFTYDVTVEDAFAGYVENTAFIVRPGGADFQDRIYSNTVTVPCEMQYFWVGEIMTYGGIEISKSVISAPANGQYYVPGETVCYTMDVKNTGVLTLNDVAVRDQLYSATDPVAVFKTMAPGEMLSASFGYRVTEMDAISGSIKNIAQAVGYDPEGRAQVGLSNEVEVLTGMEGDFPFGVITDLDIVKEETSTPANGTYYTEGETITYKITYQNIGETKLGETIIYDTLATSDIASAEMLDVGESRFCTFSYVVTAEDVAKGYVVNTAIAQFDYNGYSGTATSEPVVSDTDGDPNTTYVPGTGEIDWEKLRGTEGAVEDTCYIKAVSRDGDSIEYEVHFCTEHAQTQNSILTMAKAATTPEKQQMVWEYAYALWQKDIDAMYQEILPACDDAAKITVMSERVTNLAMVANTQFALKIAEPGQPAETAHAIADLWQDKCIDLCYLMNTAPSARVDSIFAVERAQNETEIYETCSCVITEEAEGKVLFADQYCPAHGFTYEMMELLLLTDNSAENWATVRSLWEIELNSVYNALYKAASEEGGTAYLAEYGAYLAWLPAYEQFLTMVYPENPEIVAEVMVNIIMERVLDGCERMK